MDIQVRVKFGSFKQDVEKFADRRYFVRILSKEEEPDAMDELVGLLSKKLAVPFDGIQLKQDKGQDKIFVI